jgi:hypothetical protein
MPHSYGPQFDLGPDGYHAQCACCGYEYGTHSASGDRCPIKIEQPEDPRDDAIVDYHETQRFALKTQSSQFTTEKP